MGIERRQARDNRSPFPRLAVCALLALGACGDAPVTTVPDHVPRPERELFSSDEVYARVSELAQAVDAAPESTAAWIAYGEYLFAAEIDRSAHKVLGLAVQHVTGKQAWRVRYLSTLAQSRFDPIASIESLRVLTAEDPSYVPAQVRLGVELARSVDAQQALAVLEEAYRLEPGSPDTQAALGMVLTDLARFEDAAPLLEKCLTLAPDRREVHAPLARCYFAMGREEDARRHGDAAGRAQGVMTQALPRIDPRGKVDVELTGVGPRLKRADALFEKGDLAGAIQLYEQVSEEAPTYYIVWLSWAKALLSNQRVHEAQVILERGIEHSPGASLLYDQLGGVHLSLENWSAAESALNHALELRPSSSQLLAHRAQLYNITGAYEKARADLLQAVRSDSNSSRAWIELALCNVLSGCDDKTVIADLKQIERCTAVDHRAMIRLGIALEKSPGGLLLLDRQARAISNKLDDALPFANWLGGRLLDAGQGQAAHDWLIRVYQKRAESRRLRIKVAKAAALYATQVLATDVAQAHKLLQQSMSLEPGWSFPPRLLAWSFATDERVLDAKRALELAERAWATPNARQDPLMADILAAALATNGRFDEAVELLTEAKSKLPPNLAPVFAAPFEQRLQLYRSKQPFHANPAYPLPEGAGQK